MGETMNLEMSGHVATVTITRSAMNPAFFDELGAIFKTISSDPEVRAVIICSSGKAFSYGLDLPAAFSTYGELFAGGGASTRTQLLALIRHLQNTLGSIAECPVPVIAAIHGWCIGGALDLISCCDFRYASRDTKISLRETKVAIVADIGSLQRLPPIIGQGAVRELAFTGKDIDAEKALRIGLVNEIFETREEMMAAVKKTAGEIAENSPLVVRGVKDVLNFGQGKSVADGMAYVAAWNSAFLSSEDLAEAMSAFLEKRKPEYKGK
jgi:enoyl-CoA hydratase